MLALSADYRLSRITAFLYPDPSTRSARASRPRQALYALANGGLFGVGLGQGRAKWSYLPNAHTDFIFAIIGEELGLLGGLRGAPLFATLAYTGLRIAGRNTDPLLKLVAATSTVWLVGQAAINIGYVVGLLPVTGLPLPLISAGGTSLRGHHVRASGCSPARPGTSRRPSPRWRQQGQGGVARSCVPGRGCRQPLGPAGRRPATTRPAGRPRQRRQPAR